MGRIYTGGRQRLGAALENEEIRGKEEGELDEHADGLEANLNEVAEVSNDIEAGEEQTTEAAEAAEAMEAMCVTLAAAMESGGLDQHGAAMMNNQIQYITDRLDLSGSTGTVSLESFGGVSGRVQATNIALESVKDKIREIWDKIIAAIERAMKWVADLYNKLFGAIESLEKRAKKISEAADTIQGKTAKENKIENESLAGKLVIGKTVDGKTSADVYKKFIASLPNTESYSESFNKSVIGALEKAAGGNVKEAVATFKDGGNVTKNFETTTVANPKEEGFQVGEGVTLERGKELPGRLAVCVTSMASSGDKSDATNTRHSFAALNIFFGQFSPKHAKDSIPKELAVLTPTDIESICNDVLEAAGNLKKVRSQADKRYEWKKKAVEYSKKLSDRDVKDDESSEDKQYYAAFRTLASKTPRLIDEPLLSAAKYGVTAGQALLAYCELSLRQYK